ncbi:MAG: CDP-alcohol phosphatidyltransferase family protein [Acidobacteriota bacterium]
MKEPTESAPAREDREKFWNAPNVLTLIRFILVPVFSLMVLQRRALGSLVVFLAAGLTDVLDGLAARTWHQRTRVGTIIDPLADKLLLATAFVLLTFADLSFAYSLPRWLTAAVLTRDFIIVSGGLIIYSMRGRKEFPPTTLGKISTVFQVGTVFWVILSNYVQTLALDRMSAVSGATSPAVLSVLFVATLVFTVVSGLNYVLRGIRMTFFSDRIGGRGDQAPV